MQRRRLIGIGNIVLVGVALGLVVVTAAGWPGALSAHADQPSEAAALRALVGRYLTNPGGGPPSQQQGADLLPGQLPTDAPLVVPQPPNSSIVGSVVRRQGQTAVLWDVILDAPGAPADIIQSYGQQLAALGWKRASVGLFGGGFQSIAPNDTNATFCQKIGGAPYLTVTTAPAASGQNDVRVHIDATSPGLCVTPSVPGPPPLPTTRLPALIPPTGVQVQVQLGGGGSNGNRTFSEATATTDKSAADLEAFYAQQLQAAGWTRVTGGGDGPYAWSVWMLPGGKSDQGLLAVLEVPGQDRRELRVQAAGEQQTEPNAPGALPTNTPAPPFVPSQPPPTGATPTPGGAKPFLPTRPAGPAGSGPVPATAAPFPSVGPIATAPQGVAPPYLPPNGPYTATPVPVIAPVFPPVQTVTPAS